MIVGGWPRCQCPGAHEKGRCERLANPLDKCQVCGKLLCERCGMGADIDLCIMCKYALERNKHDQ